MAEVLHLLVSPLDLLPSTTFSSHIWPHLTEEDRKALRLACKESRLLVNGEVTGARIYGSILRIGGLRLQHLFKTYPQLNCLSLSDSPEDHICGDALVDFLGCERQGKDAEGFSTDSFMQSGAARIQTLDVKQCNFLTAIDLQHLLAGCSRLQSLRASRWADASHLRALQLSSAHSCVLHHLTELDLGDSAHNVLTINDKSLAHLPHLPALRSLSLKRCTDVTDAGVSHLTADRLPGLTSLDLSYTRVTGASGFSALLGFPEQVLRCLVLQGCRTFGDAGLAAVLGRHAGGLRALYLHGTAVQPCGASLWPLAQAAGLEVLDLGNAWEVDSEGLAALSRCCALVDLRFGNVNLRRSSPPSPRQLQQQEQQQQLQQPPAMAGAIGTGTSPPLPGLSRLSLGGMFGQHGLELLLRGLPALRRLELAGLDTARDQVLGALVASCGGRGAGGRGASGSGGGAAASLQELHLARGGPDLTPAGLMRLAMLPSLQRLTLVDCPCAAGEASIQQLVHAVRCAGRRLCVEVVGKPKGPGAV